MSIKADCHLHSSFSGDSKAPMPEMIDKGISLGLETMCFTEHNDFDYPNTEEGPGSIEDVIFERRFGCAAGFAALGGRVRVEGRTLYAEPGGTLQGTVLEAPDLRGGAALVIAALAAQGSSRITHTEFIDRGYADFAQKLTALGGQIARETPRGADCPKKRTSKT